MKINHILCPVDFSDANASANEYAVMLAKANGAKITFIHVSQPDIPYASYAYVDVAQEEKLDLDQLQSLIPPPDGVETSYSIEYGLPSEQIVEYAKQNGVDLIVMGTHGRSGIGRVLMGSVAEHVVRKADCPVLAIKQGSRVPEVASDQS